MTSIIKPRFFNRKRLGISLGVIAAIFILFGLLAYFWLPGYAKNQIEILLSETLNRPVTVQSIDIKPYSLEITVHGFNIHERDDGVDKGKTFVSFDQLYIDLSIESVTRRAPVISAITLSSPNILVVREDENQFNFTDLVEEFTKPTEEDEDDGKETLFSVSNIIIKNGRFEFVDRFEQSHQEISEINFGIPFIANFDGVKANWVEPYFDAKINGAPFALDAQMRLFTNNREATLALELTNIDLTNLDEYAPIPVGISLLSGYFDSDLRLTFAQIGDEAPSINLTGSATVRQVEIENHSVAAPYRAALENLHVDLTKIDLTMQNPSNFSLQLDNVSLSRENEDNSILSLIKLAIGETAVSTKNQKVTLGEIALNGLSAKMRREEDGSIDLTKLFSPLSEQPQLPIPARKPSYENRIQVATETVETEVEPQPIEIADAVESNATTDEDTEWTIKIKRFSLNAAALHYTDITLPKAPPMAINPINLSVENIDLSGKTPLDISLDAQVNQRGSINTSGSLAWSPLATDIDIDLKAIDLVSLQGWAGDTLNALLTNGDISFQGNIKAHGEPLLIAVNGEGQLANINIFDQKNASDLVRWKNLDISGIKFVNEPLRIDINTIKLGGFFAHVILSSEGNLNLTQIVKQDEAVTSADSTGTEVTANPSPSKEATPVHIGQITLQQGNIDFNDRFIKPNYRANLTGLKGTIGPLHANKVGKVDIKGALDKTAPLEISGDMDPFGTELLLDIVAKVKDIDLPPFSPYSGKYVGYEIEKGKLSVDIQYHIKKGELTAENNIFLDQLTLGDEIESESALDVPLGLAIAILKNSRGEIDIHLPVKGSLNDPQFSIGGIVFDAFTNLLTRAITAPFSLLGSMLDGEDELSSIEFTPGFAQIDDKAAKSLRTLSEALIDRPALSLDIAGHIDPLTDNEGLKLAIMQRKIKALKLAADAKKGQSGGSLDDVELTPEEYSKYLEQVYKKEDFEKPTNLIGLTKSIPDDEMEQLILSNTVVTQSKLIDLAERRAIAAQNWLITEGMISADRVFVLGMRENEDSEDKKPGNRAEFILK